MERSGSQKFLLVISIISIVVAVLGILASLLGVMGGALFGAIDSTEASSALSGTGFTQGEASGLIVFVFLFALISSVIELVVGILGVRAANDNQKIMPVWVIALIEVILYVISLIATAVNGNFAADGLTYIISLVVAVLLFWVANNIKKQAGK